MEPSNEAKQIIPGLLQFTDECGDLVLISPDAVLSAIDGGTPPNATARTVVWLRGHRRPVTIKCQMTEFVRCVNESWEIASNRPS